MKGVFLMKNTTHRVVILKNVNSNLISQAILIVKDSARESESALLQEAERIVERYMHENTVSAPIKSKNSAQGIIIAGVAVFAAGLALLAYLI